MGVVYVEGRIMSKKDLDKYLEKIKAYTEKVNERKISSGESLQSLVKAGICNKRKEISEVYRA